MTPTLTASATPYKTPTSHGLRWSNAGGDGKVSAKVGDCSREHRQAHNPAGHAQNEHRGGGHDIGGLPLDGHEQVVRGEGGAEQEKGLSRRVVGSPGDDEAAEREQRECAAQHPALAAEALGDWLTCQYHPDITDNPVAVDPVSERGTRGQDWPSRRRVPEPVVKRLSVDGDHDIVRLQPRHIR
jgi:hypothetical protein